MFGCCTVTVDLFHPVAVNLFRKVKADGTKAILVAVFGNRMIDDTLLELRDFWRHQDLYVSQEWRQSQAFLMPIWNRTDQQDEKELLEFAAKIVQNSEAQGHLHFRETDHIENMVGVPLKPVAPNGKMHFLPVCAQKMPGRCHSVGQSEDDR